MGADWQRSGGWQDILDRFGPEFTGYSNRHGGSLPHLAGGSDLTAMVIDDQMAEIQPNPDSRFFPRAFVIGTVKGTEHMCQVRLRDPDAPIFHPDETSSFSAQMLTVILLFASEYLAALVIRFEITCDRRTWSAKITTGSSGLFKDQLLSLL